VTGRDGSGAIFFSGCNLRCSFCQNRQISRGGLGRAADLADLCLALQERGAENINLVTGSHWVPAIARGLREARGRGLRLPILWNSSGYELSLEPLEDLIDLYLPDLKTLDRELAGRFFQAPDYPAAAEKAVLRMLALRPLRYAPGPSPAPPGMVSGVLIRHLVLPGHLESTRGVLQWFARHARGRALLSLMTQYTPPPLPSPAPVFSSAFPARRVSLREYEQVLGWLDEFGIDEGFCQEPAAEAEVLPDFERPNPFDAALATPVWHWRVGYECNKPETPAGECRLTPF